MRLLSVIFFVLLFISCKTKTRPAAVTAGQFTDTLKPPKDSLSFYFPAQSFHSKPSLDNFVQNWFSSALYSFKEPVLSQGFVGHNIYRFLWLRSFHRPVVFTLNQSEGQVWLTTKMLDSQPRFYDDRIHILSDKEREVYTKKGYIVDKMHPDLLVRIADRKANIIYNKSISLSDKEWDEFEQMLARANFWNLPSNIDDGDTDGAQWVIEGHLKNNYHLVNYHSPSNSEYANAGLFLIKLSGLQEEIY